MRSSFKEYLHVAHYWLLCMQHILSQYSAVLGNFYTISLSLSFSLSSSLPLPLLLPLLQCSSCAVLVTDKQSDVYFLKFELVAMNPMRGIHTITLCICMRVYECVCMYRISRTDRILTAPQRDDFRLKNFVFNLIFARFASAKEFSPKSQNFHCKIEWNQH